MRRLSGNNHNYIFRLFASFAHLWNAQETLNLRNIRRDQLQYFFAFPLAMVFVNTQEYLFSTQTSLLGLDGGSLAFIGFCLGAALFFLFAKAKNLPTLSRLFSILAAAGFALWLVVPDGIAGLIISFLFMFGAGGCMSSGCYSFCFVLNNAERFWGSAIVVLFWGLATLNAGISFVPPLAMKFFLILLIAGMAISTFACNPDFSKARMNAQGKFVPGIWLMFYLFMAYFYIEFFISPFPEFQGNAASMLRGVFSIIALLICIIIQIMLGRSLWTMWNLSYISAIGCVAMVYAHQPLAANALHGLRSSGYFAVLYLIGCVANQFCDFRMFKKLILIVMLSCVPLYIIPELLSGTPLMYPVALGLSCVLFAAFFLLSPAFAKHLFSANWSDNLRKLTMEEALEHVERADRFETLGLTPREKEIAALLLQGMAVKQAASAIGISLDTAKFHIKNLYKKLRINGRAELFTRFGADTGTHAK